MTVASNTNGFTRIRKGLNIVLLEMVAAKTGERLEEQTNEMDVLEKLDKIKVT
jgi:hypothetical protein